MGSIFAKETRERDEENGRGIVTCKEIRLTTKGVRIPAILYHFKSHGFLKIMCKIMRFGRWLRHRFVIDVFPKHVNLSLELQPYCIGMWFYHELHWYKGYSWIFWSTPQRSLNLVDLIFGPKWGGRSRIARNPWKSWRFWLVYVVWGANKERSRKNCSSILSCNTLWILHCSQLNYTFFESIL